MAHKEVRSGHQYKAGIGNGGRQGGFDKTFGRIFGELKKGGFVIVTFGRNKGRLSWSLPGTFGRNMKSMYTECFKNSCHKCWCMYLL